MTQQEARLTTGCYKQWAQPIGSSFVFATPSPGPSRKRQRPPTPTPPPSPTTSTPNSPTLSSSTKKARTEMINNQLIENFAAYILDEKYKFPK